ncbi:MAG: alpha/beta fold hydrolase [Bacteroidota bacterium]
MKKFFLTATMILMSFWLHAQNSNTFTGNWLGAIKVGATTLRIGLCIKDSAALLSSFLMSPDQGVMRIEVDKTKTAHDTIEIVSKSISATFKALINQSGDSLKGTWKQGSKFPLVMARVAKLPELLRPQEPKGPFPYTVEEVSFTDTKTAITFAGTLTIPQGQNKFAAVVLVTGSGPQNRNEELLGHKPFLVIADYLTRNGIAVLRYDDRGVGKSGGVFSTATTLDFSQDAEAAFLFLRADKRIDSTKVGMIGHSEGGMIAPIVASRNPKVAFIIMLAGPGLKGKDILLLQSQLIAKADSTPQAEIKTNTKLNKKIYAIATKQKDDKKAAEKMRVLINNYWKTLNPEVIKKQNLDKTTLMQSIYQVLTPWFKYFLQSNPATYLVKVNCPVLALNGSKDLQVPSVQNLAAINKYLTQAKNKNFTTKQFDGLNHLFQHATTGSPTEYMEIQETFAPEVLSFITKWITQTVK